MFAVTTEGQGPGRDPFKPLTDELTRELNQTSAASFLSFFDQEAKQLLQIDENDSKRVAFSPFRLTYDTSCQDIAENFISQKQKSTFPRFEPLHNDGTNETDFSNYFTVLENLPFFYQAMKAAGVQAQFELATFSTMNKLIAQSFEFSSEKFASLVLCLALKILDVERLLLKCDNEVEEVLECKRLLNGTFSQLNLYLDQAQSSGILTPALYRRVQVVLEDIPIWNMAYSLATVEIKKTHGISDSFDIIMTAVHSLLSSKKTKLREVRDSFQDELHFKQVAGKLAQQDDWYQPIEGLKRHIDGHSFVYIEFRLSHKDLESEIDIIKALDPKPGDLLVLNIPNLIESILSLNRFEGTPIEAKDAHGEIVNYLSMLKQNPGIRPFHSFISQSRTIRQLDPSFSSFNRVIDAIRSRRVDVLVLPTYSSFSLNTSSKPDKSNFINLSATAKRIFLLNFSMSSELPLIFSGANEDIARIGVHSLVKNQLESDTLSLAIVEQAKHLSCIGVSNSALAEHAGKEYRIVKNFTSWSGNHSGRLNLPNGQVSEQPLYGADYYVFFTHGDGPNNDGDDNLNPAISPNGVVLMN